MMWLEGYIFYQVIIYAIFNLMNLIYEDRKKRVIKGQEEIEFSTSSGFHLIILKGRAKSEKQISKSSTDDEELTLEIDGKIFPKLGSNSKQVVDSPAAINGGKSHNLLKIVYFLINLTGKDHKIILKTDNPPDTATSESLEVYALDLIDTLTLESKLQAEDGDRREWITFALDNLSLNTFTVVLNLKRRFIDSDDVKVIVNGDIKRNDRNLFRKLWYFIASIFTGETQTETFNVNLSTGLHYLEFWADRMPTLEKIILNLGSLPSTKRIPTVDEPKWTENFDDDTDEILMARLILGEAENQPKEAKIGVGFTVLNRLKKQNPNWGYSIREIILKDNQYDGMWNEHTYKKVRDPLSDTSENRLQQWQESYEIAVGILSGKLSDTAKGATNFHSFKDLKDFPSWATEQTYRAKWGDIYFYELEK